MASNLPPLGPNSHSVSPPTPLNSDASQRSSKRRVICRMASPSFAPFSFLPNELTCNILSFLEDPDLRVAGAVSRLFRLSIEAVYEDRCQNRRFIPESLPLGVNYKKFLLDQFPDAIGGDFFRECFGEVDTVRVPRNFIEMAPRPGFKLVLIPEYITITVDANSPLMLDETTAVNGKKARLIEAPEMAPGLSRKIKVPVTPNNYAMLTQVCLKKNLPLQFGGILGDPSVFDQNADVGVGPSHWSYQKKDVIGLGKPYCSQPDGEKGQVEMANNEGLEIVPLGDRIVFDLSSYIKSGKIPQRAHFERTSTVVRSNDGTPWQASMFWWRLSNSNPVFRLFLTFVGHNNLSGAAAQVPAVPAAPDFLQAIPRISVLTHENAAPGRDNAAPN